ncbi:MAG: SMC-Scp complex subunit ScpB [Oligoflexia bacterium]|nr:SMC-Scp complex subunit ScpB [Oligoflexia bacterium]
MNFDESANEKEVKSGETDLEAAAQEWLADQLGATSETAAEPEREQPVESPAPADGAGIAYSTLITDPYGLNTIQISEQQQRDGELDLEEVSEEEPADDEFDLDETLKKTMEDSGEQLEKLARVMEEESARHAEEVEKAAEEALLTEDAAQQLAKEIAEDKLLQEQLAAEQAALDEAEANDPELLAALPQSLDVAEMESCLETLLFLSDKPISVEKLRSHIGEDFPLPLYQESVTNLRDRYARPHHGFELVEVAGGLQFRTKPGRAALARKLAKVQIQRLSGGAMESLAIIAYRQPIMKEEIDKIRGVDSSYFIRLLMDRKLIEISGRSELPGRPMLYSTTKEFLEVFNLKDLSAMPSLREIEQMIPSSQSANPEDEDPRVKEMRRLVSQMKSDTSTSLIYDHREDEKILQEIRERVNAIPTSTPTLEEQKAQEKAAKEAALQALKAAEEAKLQPELPAALPSELPSAEGPEMPPELLASPGEGPQPGAGA